MKPTNPNLSAAQAAVLLALSGAAHMAGAADISVRALEKGSGAPVQDASICLGTPADPVQLGAVRSGRDGEVTFRAVPDSVLVVTVSKQGYRGERRNLRGGRAETMTFLLPQGGGGPDCRAPERTPEQELLEVEGFRINGGQPTTRDRNVTLAFSVSGGATHFRASEGSDITAAPWQPLGNGDPRFQLSRGLGEKQVYLQLRKYRDVAGASLESRSDVLSDTIELRP